MDTEHLDRHGYTIKYADGMAVLMVPPKEDRTRPVYADDVTARMKVLGVPPVPAKRIREIVEEASGHPEPLVPWPDGAALCARVSIEVSEDAMTAKAVVWPPKPGGASVNAVMLKGALESAGVVRGIDDTAMKTLLRPAASPVEVFVAKGRTASAGKPAHTECLFVTDRGKPWKEVGSGRIDLKELNFIQNRKAGDLLARRVESVPPEDGFDVQGRVIEAEAVVDEPPLTAGDGVVEVEEGLEAAIDGNVRLEEGTVCVEPSVTVKNVDYSTGNIEFDGSVAVEGTIADGFTVKATGDIQVGKTTGRAQLESGRNLVLAAGMVGDGEGHCSVGGSLYAKFLESCVCTVAGDLVVTEAVLHSETEIDGSLFLTEGRGEITGGISVVGGSVDCKRVGNIYSGETRIYAGCPPKDLAAFNELAGELKELRDRLDDLDRQIDYLKTKNTGATEITAMEREKVSMIQRLKDGAGNLKTMRTALEPENGTCITARDRIYPGAGLFFGLEEFPIGDKGMERAVLRRESGRTAIHGFVENKTNETD